MKEVGFQEEEKRRVQLKLTPQNIILSISVYHNFVTERNLTICAARVWFLLIK